MNRTRHFSSRESDFDFTELAEDLEEDEEDLEDFDLAFCATGEGGGRDPHCSPGGSSPEYLKSERAKFEHMRDVAKEKIKEIKAGAPGHLSVYKAMRADLNKQIAAIDDKLKGVVSERPEQELPHEGPDLGNVLAFEKMKDADAWGEEHYEPWLAGLNPDEASAVSNYTGAGFMPINSILRQDLAEGSHLEERIALIDHALEKSPPLEKDLLVHRGVTYGADTMMGKLRAGDVFRDKAFVSTSVNQKITEKFAKSAVAAAPLGMLPTRFDIKVPAGSKGAYMAGWLAYKVGGHSEGEFLLPRGSKFKINAVHESKSMRVITAEVCHVC